MKKREYKNLVNTAAMILRFAEKYERMDMGLNEVGAQSLGKACWHLEKAALLIVQAAANEKTDC